MRRLHSVLLFGNLMGLLAFAQLPDGAPATANASANGLLEIKHIANAYKIPPVDVIRLDKILHDWPNVGQYAEDNKELAGKHVSVVFLGDSITYRWADAANSTFLSDHGYVGRGIGGQTTSQMLLRMPSDVLALHPKVLVVHGGTNDLAQGGPNSVEQIIANITMICDVAKANRIRVILASLLPVNDYYRLRTDARPPQKIIILNKKLKKIAIERHITFVDYYSLLSDGHDRLEVPMTADGLHPNRDGFRKIEPILQRAIETNLHGR